MRLALAFAASLLGGCTKSPAATPVGAAPEALAEGAVPAPVPVPPRLVVVVVVDQMRGDYLQRFQHLWRAGFARMLAEGAVYRNAHHEHAVTFTAAGHATLATGVHPSRHGMISNRYWDRAQRRKIEIADDAEARVVGRGGPPAQSAVRLRVPGVSDWLRAASPDSKALALGLKDRAAICLGGQHPTLALWHDEGSGRFVSSSYYVQELPPWVRAFNDTVDASALVKAGWDRVAPPETHAFPGEDRVPYEADGVHAVFPHDEADLLALDPDPNRALRWSPAGDLVTFGLVSAALEHENLGSDDAPDLLLVTVSSTDYVGHRFGPDSHELLDTYLRLDVELGRLLDELDARVGNGAWALVLTSDHGVMPIPERTTDGKRISMGELESLLRGATRAAVRATGVRPAPRPQVSDGVYLDFANGVAPEQRARYRAAFARALEASSMVSRAYPIEDLANPSFEGPFVAAFRRSWDEERSPDVFVLLEPHHLVTPFQGSSHGTPYDHDTHVPLVLFGAGVRPGVHDHHVGAVDVAPTLATLLGLSVPEGLDGHVLTDALAR